MITGGYSWEALTYGNKNVLVRNRFCSILDI